MYTHLSGTSMLCCSNVVQVPLSLNPFQLNLEFGTTHRVALCVVHPRYTNVVLLHCGCLSLNPFIEFRIRNNSSSSDVLYIQASISISAKYESN